jgi:cytochrome c-type protein NrfB
MKRTGLMMLVSILLLAAALAAERNMGAPTLVIPAGIKPDVTLPHAVHQTALENCDRCHNLFPQAAGSIAQMKESGALKKMQVMKQCRECHKEMTEAGKKAGPVNCDECHRKEGG